MKSIEFICNYLMSNSMDFREEVVDNPKIENEKSAQKRQFCLFTSKNVYHFWTRNECPKKNYN